MLFVCCVYVEITSTSVCQHCNVPSSVVEVRFLCLDIPFISFLQGLGLAFMLNYVSPFFALYY